MKRKASKKVTALLMAVIMLFTAYPVSAAQHEEANNGGYFVATDFITTSETALATDAVTPMSAATLSVSTTSARAGGFALLDIKIDNNPGFANMLIRVDYPSQLTLTSYSNRTEEAMFVGLTQRSGHFFTGWINPAENYTSDGILLSLTFSVAVGTEPDDLPVTVRFENAQNTETPSNFAGDYLEIAIQNGGVTVTDALVIGDTNGDGRFTSLDANIIARYLVDHFPEGSIDERVMDVNCDGRVTTADLTRLARWLIGIYETLCPHGGCYRCDPSIPKPTEDIKVGDIIPFGGSNWLVLDIQDNHAKILHETVITSQQYHNTFGEETITWEASNSRAWLNNEFYNKFTASERARIRETYVVNNDSPWTHEMYNHSIAPGGNDTIDKIFLLSVEEVLQYFGDSGLFELGKVESNRYASIPGLFYWGFTDQYDDARIAYNESGSPSYWWLRSTGFYSYDAAFVLINGVQNIGGWLQETYPEADRGGGLRPAMCINIDGFDPNPQPTEDVKVGDTIPFGGQNWLVLDIQGNHAKILHQTVISNQSYHNEWVEGVTWETSSSREWLNNQFYNEFTASEQARIRETNVINNDNPWYGTQGGNNTTDKIFLLSLEEVLQYFGDSGQLADKNHPNNDGRGFHDEYSSARAAYNDTGSSGLWWLRSPGISSSDVVSVGYQGGGYLYVHGNSIVHNNFFSPVGGLRPAMWINIDGFDPNPQPMEDVKIGDTIPFSGQNWLVLDIQGNHAKILRETVIANQPYHNIEEEVTWETSSSRAWLNNQFYNDFTASEQARIRETNVVNNDNPWTFSMFGFPNHTPGGNNTTDKIFLLSIEEVVQYFGNSGLLELGKDESNLNGSISGLFVWGIFENNHYSNARIAYDEMGSPSWWWLRSPGTHSDRASFVYAGTRSDRDGFVYDDGSLHVGGFFVDATGGGLRPAMWINLES